MLHEESDSIAHESTYPQLELPEFESTIPPHLLNGVSPENQFVMEHINIQTQYIKWLCEAAIDTNQQVRKTNGRLKKVESWKDKLSSLWVTVGALFTFLSTVVIIAVKVYKTVVLDQSISIF